MLNKNSNGFTVEYLSNLAQHGAIIRQHMAPTGAMWRLWKMKKFPIALYKAFFENFSRILALLFTHRTYYSRAVKRAIDKKNLPIGKNCKYRDKWSKKALYRPIGSFRVKKRTEIVRTMVKKVKNPLKKAQNGHKCGEEGYQST